MATIYGTKYDDMAVDRGEFEPAVPRAVDVVGRGVSFLSNLSHA